MPRFYIPPQQWNPERLVLGEEETHHALHVLRMKPGDRATVFNGQGTQAAVEIAAAGKHSLELKCLEMETSAPPGCRITLGQAIPKGKNMEWIVQKATELGVSAIVPLLTEHTIVQPEPKKREKWQAAAIEACKQCGQNWLPEIHPPQSLAQALRRTDDLKLIASLHPGAMSFREILSQQREPSSVLILIGPEGDFSPAETALALENGCRLVTLGPIVLRVETAAFYALSVLAYEYLHP